MKDTPEYIVVNRASGKMITHSASKIQIRNFEVTSDEPPSRGGEDRAPSPLEYIVASLCA